jgi:hypothetical protein
MLKSNGKLLIDLGVSADLPRTTWATNLAAAGFSYSPVRIAQSQNIILCELTQTFNGVSQDHEKLWLVKNSNLVISRLKILTSSGLQRKSASSA